MIDYAGSVRGIRCSSLLSRGIEIELAVVVVPSAGHRLLVDFPFDYEVHVSSTAWKVDFKMDCAGSRSPSLCLRMTFHSAAHNPNLSAGGYSRSFWKLGALAVIVLPTGIEEVPAHFVAGTAF